MEFAVRVGIAALVIAFTSWLSGRRPEPAGFIIALPVASILALAFSYWEHRDREASITFAKSILLAVPVSYLFFVPFFPAGRFNLGFWDCYFAGLLLLGAGYFLHRFLMGLV